MIADVAAFKLVRAIEDCLPFVGKDDSLPMLTGIQMRVRGDVVTLSATDRYVAAQSRFHVLSGDEHDTAPSPVPADVELLLPYRAAQTLVRALKPATRDEYSAHGVLAVALSVPARSRVNGPDYLHVAMLDHPVAHDLGSATLRLPLLDSKFPDVDTLLDVRPDDVAGGRLSIDGQRLAAVSKRERRRHEPMRVIISGPSKPVRVHFGSAENDDELRVLIMPMRHESATYDNWSTT